MKTFVNQYGLFTISCISIVVLFILIYLFLASDNSVLRTTNKSMFWNGLQVTKNGSGEFSLVSSTADSVNSQHLITNILNTTAEASIPRFSSIKADPNAYFIDPTSFTIDEAGMYTIPRDYFYDIDKLLADGTFPFNSSNFELVLIKYEPMTEYVGGLATSAVIEEVPAVDKYGNFLYEADGKTHIMTQRIEYSNSKPSDLQAQFWDDKLDEFEDMYGSVVTDSNIQLSADVSYKFKAIYRYVNGTFKGECTKIFTTKIREQQSRHDELFKEYFKDGEPVRASSLHAEENLVSDNIPVMSLSYEGNSDNIDYGFIDYYNNLGNKKDDEEEDEGEKAGTSGNSSDSSSDSKQEPVKDEPTVEKEPVTEKEPVSETEPVTNGDSTSEGSAGTE